MMLRESDGVSADPRPAASRFALRRRRRRAARGKDKPPRLSAILQRLSSGPAERITFAELVQAFGDRAFGALMFIFAVPNVLPLPPGSSSVLGAPLIVVVAQLTVGRSTLWLPPAVLRRSMRVSDFRRITEKVRPWLRWAERLLSPRLTFLFGPIGDRAIGALCLLLSIILFLPIPGGNMVPALAVALFALALLERDGLMAIVGLLVAMVGIGWLVALSGAIWIGFKAFFHAAAGLFG